MAQPKKGQSKLDQATAYFSCHPSLAGEPLYLHPSSALFDSAVASAAHAAATAGDSGKGVNGTLITGSYEYDVEVCKDFNSVTNPYKLMTAADRRINKIGYYYAIKLGTTCSFSPDIIRPSSLH